MIARKFNYEVDVTDQRRAFLRDAEDLEEDGGRRWFTEDLRRPPIVPFASKPALLPLAISVLVALSGCARRATPVEDGIRTQTLLVGNAAEPADLDPQVIYAQTDANLVYTLFEPLTWVDPKTSLAVPAAAEGWDVSPDGLVYTFHLRPNLRWSNGDTLTADEFVYSYQRILSPAFAASYAYMLWPLRNAKAFNSGKITDFAQVGVAAPDARTLRLTLEKPTPYLPTLVSH
jgi:oligopeptide transport system substrate-binding protein